MGSHPPLILILWLYRTNLKREKKEFAPEWATRIKIGLGLFLFGSIGSAVGIATMRETGYVVVCVGPTIYGIIILFMGIVGFFKDRNRKK